MNEAQIVSAIDAAQAACRHEEMELHVPSRFIVDVLINSTLHAETIDPDFLEWVRGILRNFPGLGPDQRQTLLQLTEA